ncbi:MAG: hypothetical protein H6765_07615 [Candidatus Peribacteria bacterium]|nr:MAG: hypothetical protein H6765_07615 [Candidatus Peribacteria bacterium]
MWYDGAKDTNINPLLGMCIGFAETSFKNFKSENNIGNVGNDDSGNTVEFDTPLAGVAALYATLNNQYLGEYQTLDQLSRYGNLDGYIYASSPFNRQKNIMTCLSSIYDTYIPEDFAFRLE